MFDDLNYVAIRSFRDIADGDYIAARMAYRAGLQIQFHWSSQQAIEKYLKCILLMNRVPARKVWHSLSSALDLISRSGKLHLDLTESAQRFIEHVDRVGRFRYLEVSTFVDWRTLYQLDQAVWELRRYCTSTPTERAKVLVEGKTAPRQNIPGGFLESVMKKKPPHPARSPLVWQNGFFGRTRKVVKVRAGWQSINAPLFNADDPLDLLNRLKPYVYLPADVVKHWTEYAKAKARAKSKQVGKL